jgi:hypothetical protein
MTKFIDPKKKREIEIDNSFLSSRMTAIASGATLSVMKMNVDWSEIGKVVGLRDLPRNTPLGVVFTRPNSLQTLLETVWEDDEDNKQADGDITLFDLIKKDEYKIERLTESEVKDRFPDWFPYHHGNKNYLK